MPDVDLLTRIASTHGCSPELVRAVATDCLAALNETSYKDSSAAAVAQACEALGGLAAWHLMGLVVDAADRGDAGGLVRAYIAIDETGAQYDPIARRWDDELQSTSPTP
jgi:hypothetical protein